jgi:hypothetical protein
MIISVYSSNGLTFLRFEEGEPECGKDFCDECGDCLACFQDNPYCNCRWVKYEEE